MILQSISFFLFITSFMVILGVPPSKDWIASIAAAFAGKLLYVYLVNITILDSLITSGIGTSAALRSSGVNDNSAVYVSPD
jgi:hypothetical protein